MSTYLDLRDYLHNALMEQIDLRPTWLEFEREFQVILLTANDWAKRNGVQPLSSQQIADAEISARGHYDYPLEWATQVARLLGKQPRVEK